MRLLGRLFTGSLFIIGGAFVAMLILLNVLNVLGRYIFSTPIYWAEEVMTYLMIWTVMIGTVIGVKRNEHLSIDVIFTFLGSMTKGLRIVAEVITLVVSLLVLVSSYEITAMMMSFGEVAVASRIPSWTVHISLFVGFGGCAIYSALNIMKHAVQPRKAAGNE